LLQGREISKKELWYLRTSCWLELCSILPGPDDDSRLGDMQYRFLDCICAGQAQDTVWIHLPRGFLSTRPGKTCLRVKRSQYGLLIAPRLWHQHLFAALTDMGLTPSKHDQCLLFKTNLLAVLYVDDAGSIAAPDSKIIDQFISELEGRSFELAHEERIDQKGY
jgi:hypothetical protein